MRALWSRISQAPCGHKSGAALIVGIAFMMWSSWAPLAAGEGVPPIKPMKDVESHVNLPYLAHWRYTGDPGFRGDYRMMLNLYVPPEVPGRRTPLIIYIHGGAYSAGHKDYANDHPVYEVLLDAGFAVASINYILTNKGIVPQVWWDFEDACRYLRLNAERYRLDPTAFGAYGISAASGYSGDTGHAKISKI